MPAATRALAAVRAALPPTPCAPRVAGARAAHQREHARLRALATRAPSSAPRDALADRILLRDLHFFGYHGCLPAERTLGQRFVVDIDIVTAQSTEVGRGGDKGCRHGATNTAAAAAANDNAGGTENDTEHGVVAEYSETDGGGGLATAARTDALADTIDYARVCEQARAIVERGTPRNLIERVASEIIDGVLREHARADTVTCRITKPHVALPGTARHGGVAVELTRRRGRAQ